MFCYLRDLLLFSCGMLKKCTNESILAPVPDLNNDLCQTTSNPLTSRLLFQ